MKIRYNIAKQRKINYLHFGILACILLLFSLGFILGGIKTLSSSAQQFRNKKNELRICQEEKEAKARKNKEQKSEIEGIKKKWKNRRGFANNLIKNRTFPYLEQLDKLEKLLPAGVFINNITLSTESGSKIQFNLGSHSPARLIEAYNVFSKYSMDIKKEQLRDGLYNAVMIIKLDN